MCSCSHCMNLFHEESARSSIFHMNLTGDVFLDISLSSRQANSLACSCVRVCVCQFDRTERGVLTRTTCLTSSVSPFSYWPIWTLTSPGPSSNGAWMVLCVFLCVNVSVFVELFHSCSFGGKIDPSVPDFRETPLMERFCMRAHPCRALHKMLPSL